jgi:tRNA 2-thiouridine synthesizing protein C
MAKKYLFVMRQPPHCGAHVQETLDIILTTAAFDQEVALLFVDDGVFQIKSGQNPEKYQLKDTAAIFKALQIYDIHELYAEVESLQDRGLKPGNLLLPVQEVYRRDIAALLAGYDIVFGG